MNMHDVCRYYLFLYSHWLPQPLCDVVTRLDNCDGIVINFLVSHVTRQPPITVAHRQSSSSRHGNWELFSSTAESSSFYARQYCVRRLSEELGYMPLIRSSVRLEPLLHRDPVSVVRKKYRQMENAGL